MAALCHVLAVLLALSTITELRAAPAEPFHLNIVLTLSRARPKAGDTKPAKQQRLSVDRTAWVNACSALGASMTVGNGPWGFGAFDSYTCYVNKKLASGTEKESEWTLRVQESTAGLRLTLVHKPKNKPATVLNRINLPATKKAYGYFKDIDLADLTAYALLDSMPVMMMVKSTEKVGSGAAVSGRKSRQNAKFLLPNPPENMSLFETTWDEESSRFKTETKGNMNFLGYRVFGKTEQTQTASREEVTPLWSVDKKSEQVIAGGALWAHSVAGPGMRKKELNNLVDSAYRFLALGVRPSNDTNLLTGKDSDVTDVAFRENFMSGVVSLRYGMSVITDPQLLKESSLFGLVAEIRSSGNGGGLRFYYDISPQTSEVIDTNGVTTETKFKWNRMALGWAFGLNIQNWTYGIFDRIDITPKINLWNLDAKSISTDGETDFKLENDPSVGWELGLERTIFRVLVRGWYGTDIGGFVKKAAAKENTSIHVNRFGLDTWIAGPRWTQNYSFRSSFLAFFWYEGIALANDRDDTASNASTMDLTLAYIGLGTGIQW